MLLCEKVELWTPNMAAVFVLTNGTLCLFLLLSFVPLEQILNSIKQEYKRIQKRKHLDGGYQQSECCYSPESPSQSSTMNVSSMPGWLRNTLPTGETAPELLWHVFRQHQ